MFRLINGLGNISNKYQVLGKEGFSNLVRDGGVISDADYLPFVPPAVRRIIRTAVAADPAQRYQTALDMRRALENLHYPGIWTVDSSGRPVGRYGSSEFTYDENILARGRMSFAAYRTNLLSNRRTRVTRFCSDGLKRPELARLKRQFMQQVIMGSV